MDREHGTIGQYGMRQENCRFDEKSGPGNTFCIQLSVVPSPDQNPITTAVTRLVRLDRLNLGRPAAEKT